MKSAFFLLLPLAALAAEPALEFEPVVRDSAWRLSIGLRAAPGIKADVAIAPAPAEAPAAADFGLAEAAIDAAAGDAPGRPLAIQPDYAPPAEDDIAFEAADEGMAGVQLDGGLRF